MSLYGRYKNPGEKSVNELVDQRSVLNRTIRAQIVDVNADNGYVIINYDALPGGGRHATVPPLWMSFPQVGGASWGRYMPQRSDLVKVSFDFDDHPHIVGYDVSAAKAGVADGASGWPSINNLHATAKADPDAKVIVTRDGRDTKVGIAKYAQFNPLNPGEYDFMSSGGSYIYGTNRGKLYMAGGGVSISLTRNDASMTSIAQMWAHKADDCDFKFGQVRRTGTNSLDSTVSVDPTGRFKEFMVRLKSTTVPGTLIDIASLHMGNIIDASNNINMSYASQAIRYLMKTYTDVGIVSHSHVVDTMGNVEISSTTATTGVKFNYPIGNYESNFINVTQNAAGSYTVNSPSINLQGPLGLPSAINPLLLTTIYRPAEDAMTIGLAANIATLASAVAALAGIVASMGAGLTSAGASPDAPPKLGISLGVVGSAGTAAAAPGGVAAGVAAAAPIVASTFVAAGPTYLSTIARTG